MRVAAYARVSTKKKEQLDSLENQTRFFEEYAKSRGYTLVAVYADEKSGRSIQKREGFQQLLADGEKKLFDMVLFRDATRLARNTVDSLQSFRQLIECGITLHFINIGFTATRENEFQLTLLSAVSQGEGEAISSRARFGYLQSAKKGRVPTRAYGYDHITPYELAINEEEAGVVKRIFDMYVNQGYGVRKITRILIEEGIKTKNGGLWCPRTVSGILSNELYIGKLVSHKTTTTSYLDRKRNKVPEDSNIVFTRPEYAIISEDMFRRAQEMLAERKEQYRRTGMRVSSQNNFSSVLQCECCGRAFTRLYHMDRNGHRRWGCSKRNMGGKAACPNATRICEDELVAEIKRYFSEVLKDRDNLIKAVSAELQKAAHLGTSTSEKKRIQAELASLKRQFRKQEEKFDADLITMSELKERVRPIRKRINDLEARLEAIENSPRDENYIKNIVQNIYTGIEELLNLSEWSNAQVKRVIEKITVNVKGEVAVYLKPLGRLGLETPVNIGVREKADTDSTETQNNSSSETNALNENAGKNAGNVRYINFAQNSHNGASQPAQPTPCDFMQFRGTRNCIKSVNWRKSADFSPNGSAVCKLRFSFM